MWVILQGGCRMQVVKAPSNNLGYILHLPVLCQALVSAAWSFSSGEMIGRSWGIPKRGGRLRSYTT